MSNAHAIWLPREDTVFERLGDGDVRMIRTTKKGKQKAQTFAKNEWVNIVAAVSSGVFCNNRIYLAEEFHG